MRDTYLMVARMKFTLPLEHLLGRWWWVTTSISDQDRGPQLRFRMDLSQFRGQTHASRVVSVSGRSLLMLPNQKWAGQGDIRQESNIRGSDLSTKVLIDVVN